MRRAAATVDGHGMPSPGALALAPLAVVHPLPPARSTPTKAVGVANSTGIHSSAWRHAHAGKVLFIYLIEANHSCDGHAGENAQGPEPHKGVGPGARSNATRAFEFAARAPHRRCRRHPPPRE